MKTSIDSYTTVSKPYIYTCMYIYSLHASIGECKRKQLISTNLKSGKVPMDASRRNCPNVAKIVAVLPVPTCRDNYN